MILLDAVYVHNYGGKSILDLLIRFLKDKNLIDSFYFLLDSRYKNSFKLGSKFKYVNASLGLFSYLIVCLFIARRVFLINLFLRSNHLAIRDS